MRLIDRSKLEVFGATCKSQDYMDGVKDTLEYIDNLPTVDAIPVEHVEKMIEIVKSLPNADYSLKYFAVNVMDALISGWRVEEKKNEK